MKDKTAGQAASQGVLPAYGKGGDRTRPTGRLTRLHVALTCGAVSHAGQAGRSDRRQPLRQLDTERMGHDVAERVKQTAGLLAHRLHDPRMAMTDRGDPEALEECYRSLGPLVVSYLTRYVPYNDVEDVLQRVFYELWRVHERYDPNQSLRAWVLGIARKRAIDHLRKRRDIVVKVRNDYNDSFPDKAPASAADIGPPTVKQIGDKKYPAYKKGGKIRRTGLAYVHKGETVIPAAKRTARQARKVPGVAQVEGQVKGAVAGADDLAVSRYDSLTAEEITAKLSALSQIDLAKIDSYERKNQNRTTILNRITTLRGNEPWPGYDELTVPEVQAVLAEGDEDRANQTRSYERAHKNRATVLQATEREHSNA